jgi:dihydrofolate reductase
MSKLIVSEFVTLDGVMEAPGGEPTHPHAGWVFESMSAEQEQYKLDEVREAGSLLLGRVTYEGFSAAWPGRGGEFADKMNSMPKHVVSSTLSEPLAWSNSSLIRGDVAGKVTELRQQDGGPILVAGSQTLVHSLVEDDLVDEYRIMIFPVLLGGGRRLFPDSRHKRALKLVDTRRFDSGVVVHTYHPAR